MLQRAFRRTKAEGSSGPWALCCEKTASVRRPVSGLAPKASADMYGLIRDLNRNNKITIIFTLF